MNGKQKARARKRPEPARAKEENGAASRSEQEEEHVVIRTGLYLVEEGTGRRWQVLTCGSSQESSSWIETVTGGDPAPEGARRITCIHHKKKHEAISLAEAAYREVLNVQEGGVYVPFGQIVSMLLDPVGDTPTPKSVVAFPAERRTA